MTAGMDEIRAAAHRVFRSDQAVDAFLELSSPTLGGTPRALIEAGRGDEVLQFVERLAREAPPAPSIFGVPLSWLRRSR